MPKPTEEPTLRFDVIHKTLCYGECKDELNRLKQPGLFMGDEAAIVRNIARFIDQALEAEVQKRRRIAENQPERSTGRL